MNKTKKQYDATKAVAVNTIAAKFGVTAIYVRHCLQGKSDSDNAKKIVKLVTQLKTKLDKIINQYL